MQFDWTQGFHSKGEAQPVGEELQTLRQKYGGLITAEAVVEHAKSPDSALHGYFEWDDATAAHQHRLAQARRLIRAVVVTENGDKTPRHAFIHVESQDVGTYMDAVEALQDGGLRLQVLEQARKEMASFIRRYEELTELAELIAVAKNTVQTLSQASGS